MLNKRRNKFCLTKDSMFRYYAIKFMSYKYQLLLSTNTRDRINETYL